VQNLLAGALIDEVVKQKRVEQERRFYALAFLYAAV
jgi:hypothetical protein